MKLCTPLDILLKNISIEKIGKKSFLFGDIIISMRAHIEKIVKNDQKEPAEKLH